MKYENLEQANRIYGRVKMLNEERDKCAVIIEAINSETSNYVGIYTLLSNSRFSDTLMVKRHEAIAFFTEQLAAIDDEKSELIAEFDKL